jgi:hypothetical protein
MKRLTLLLGAILAGVLTLTCVMAAPRTDSAKQQGVKTKVTKGYTVVHEAARILKDVEEQAYDVTDHASTLEAASRLGASREFNAEELDALRDDVNGMGKKMQLLEALSRNEAGWEQGTVKRVMPLLKEVAATTDQAINYVDSKPTEFALSDYGKITKKLYDQSTSLWTTLHDSVKLASLREREEQLKKTLKVASKASD